MARRKYFEYLTKLIPIGFISWLIYSAIKYPNEFATSFVLGIANGSIYALIAVGFGLIYNTTKILNLAHGEMFMLGTVGSTFFLVEIFDATSANLTNFVLLFIAILLAMVLGASVSWLTNATVFSHLNTKQKMAPVVASLGVALIIQNIAIKWNGSTADVFVNGTKQVSGTTFTTTQLQFLAHSSTSGDVPKFIQQMALFPTPLSDTDCTTLTT